MDDKVDAKAKVAGIPHAAANRFGGRRLQGFLAFLAALSLAFAFPLFELFAYSRQNELYSHVVLIPVVTAYLVVRRLRENKPPQVSHWAPALAFTVFGVGLFVMDRWGASHGWRLAHVDHLALTTGSYLAFATAGLFLFLGNALLRAVLFPWCFLIFLVPFPEAVERGIEAFFQQTSADVAQFLMSLAGLPVFREGLFFKLPGILLEVARECSGIRSSLVLFITSLLGGMMLLRRPWSRGLLVAAVIPLAIIRNAFRILTIAWLCVHVGPEMIHSPIHRRGGPLFFLLSLIPFFALLFCLRWFENRRSKEHSTHDSN